jgi:cytochrome c biogenesis protein CcmG, thiol:disulfide interchange protein DsbE
MSRRMRLAIRWRAVVLLLAGLGLSSSDAAADLASLMREFNVSPAGLKPASTFSLKSLEGRTVALAEQRGRPVLLYFWATW